MSGSSQARAHPVARTRGRAGAHPGAVRAIRVALLSVTLAIGITGPSVIGAEEVPCVATERNISVARMWDEALLAAIRRDYPSPVVHARNLFHMSAAMWDAWATYDPQATGYLVTEKLESTDIGADRERAISYAAYRLLSHRYRKAIGAAESLDRFEATMQALCYPVGRTRRKGDTPTALGNRIAAAYIDYGLTDGSRERAGYKPKDYKPVNEPMIVTRAGTQMVDPNRWQPLALEVFVTQNGIEVPDQVQYAIGPHWGHVKSFALPPSDAGVPIDPGPPPHLGDPATDAQFKAAVLEVIRYSSMLDPDDGVMIDVSPASMGDNTLGTYDGDGYEVNPVTGEPYEPKIVARGDWARVLVQFWADGPDSETPPGHWNTLANALTEYPDFERRWAGQGPELDPLEWDVKVYFALNGAVHDAGIAAWGLKGHYDYVRPISMIRHMAGLGQSSDPEGPSYHPEGLLLEPGLVEVITPQSSAPGARHEHLAEFVGEIAIRTWRGEPEDTETQVGGVGWIRAAEWVAYQRATFVTPSFSAYVSGHSTFSRAAAEVLTEVTGSPYVPGGLGSWTVPTGDLEFEAGPATDIVLQWATYQDAADQAGISRLYGGIHVPADDLAGRIGGWQCGQDAWKLANSYFEGSPLTASRQGS